MNDAPRPEPSGRRCDEFVELVTAYLDDALPDDLRDHVDEHLAECPGCRTVLAQWRSVIDLSGELAESDVEEVDPVVEERLYATFRRLRRR